MQLLFPPSSLNCCLRKSKSTHSSTSYTFSVPSPFPLLEYRFQLSIIQPANTLILPLNTHNNTTTSAARVKQYYTTKTKLLPPPTASLFPTHRFYLTVKLDNARAHISDVKAQGAHHKHLGRSTASSRAAWFQVSIIIPPPLRAPGNHKKRKQTKKKGKTKTTWQVDTLPIFNHLPAACSMKRCFKTGLLQRVFCGGFAAPVSPTPSKLGSPQARKAGRTCISSHILARFVSPSIFCHYFPADGIHCWRDSAGETIPSDFSALLFTLDIWGIADIVVGKKNQGNGT